MGWFSKQLEEGKADTARVRRVYPHEAELVNRKRGYQRVPLACIDGATEEYYCRLCGSMRELSHFPH